MRHISFNYSSLDLIQESNLSVLYGECGIIWDAGWGESSVWDLGFGIGADAVEVDTL